MALGDWFHISRLLADSICCHGYVKPGQTAVRVSIQRHHGASLSKRKAKAGNVDLYRFQVRFKVLAKIRIPF